MLLEWITPFTWLGVSLGSQAVHYCLCSGDKHERRIAVHPEGISPFTWLGFSLSSQAVDHCLCSGNKSELLSCALGVDYSFHLAGIQPLFTSGSLLLVLR